jgi:ABC-type nitrate/sulfonate/bicarbonate transport system substrate-binding protein
MVVRDRVRTGLRGATAAGVRRRRVLRGLAAAPAACLAAAAVGPAPANAAWAADRVSLQLRWDHQFQFAGYYAARWLGYYAEAGLEVEIRSAVHPDGTIADAVEEVGAGRADFGVDAGDILVGYDRGMPLAVLASVFQASPVTFFARAGTRLETPADLAGLRVGRWRDVFMEVELQALLRAEGIDPAGLSRIDLTADAIAAFLTAGPGAAGFDVLPGTRFSVPYRAKELGVVVGELRPQSFGINFYGDSLFTHESMAHGRPDLAQRFTEASLKGWRYALAHVDEVARRIAAELPQVSPPRDPEGYNLFQAGEVAKLAFSDLVPLGNINPERWRRMHEEMSRSGMVARPLDLGRFVVDPERLAVREGERLNRLLTGGASCSAPCSSSSPRGPGACGPP